VAARLDEQSELPDELMARATTSDGPGPLSPRHLSAQDAPPRTWDDWFVQARNRWAAGDPEGAFADTLRARREDPEQVPVHVQLAELGHHGHGDAAEALTSIEALHARGVSYESMGTHESRILFLLGRYADAAEVLDRQVAQAPDDDFAQYSLACYAALASGAAGSEAERASHRARALAALERAIALSPGNAADAAADPDFEPLRDDPTYRALVEG
jgi:tetratricopeptide (TPR) repeat protein